MLTLDGIVILADVETIIEDLQHDLHANGIHYLADVRSKDTAKNVMVTCISHNNGQERKPSLGISKMDVERNGKLYPAGTAHCFTCGYTADLFEFVSHCWGTNDRNYGKRYVLRKYNTMDVAQRPDITLNYKRERKRELSYNYLDESELDLYRYTSDYLYERGFDDTTIDFYEYGLDIKNKAITMPVRDHKGGLVFIKKRFIKPPPGGDKYMNEKGIPKQHILYGFYQVLLLIQSINNGTCTNKKLEENYKRYGLFLTEGEFNASYLMQNGYPTVSLLGRILFEDKTKKYTMQKELLLRYGIRDLVLWMDNDDPGKEAIEKITQQTYRNFRVLIPDFSQFPQLNDANNFTPEQLDQQTFITPW
jgi:DNA primase (bacterial type)